MVTLICPVYNEEKYIKNILTFFSDSDPAEKEIFFIDGGSIDDTVNIIKYAVQKTLI